MRDNAGVSLRCDRKSKNVTKEEISLIMYKRHRVEEVEKKKKKKKRRCRKEISKEMENYIAHLSHTSISSMYPNGGHGFTNYFKARFEWKMFGRALWRNGDKNAGKGPNIWILFHPDEDSAEPVIIPDTETLCMQMRINRV